MTNIKLYGTRLSPFVEKVARALMFKGLSFEMVPLKGPGDLKKWNETTQKMPVLDIDTEKIYDSTFILRRLDELHSDPPLASGDPVEAAAQRQLEDWSDESLYWYVMALRWSEANAPKTLKEILSTAPVLVRPLARAALKRGVAQTPKVQGLGRLPVSVLVREIGLRMDDLEKLLAGRPYFHADQLSLADLALYGQISVLGRDATPEGQEILQGRVTINEWKQRVEEVTEANSAS